MKREVLTKLPWSCNLHPSTDTPAAVVELVDTLAWGASGHYARGGSSPLCSTFNSLNNKHLFYKLTACISQVIISATNIVANIIREVLYELWNLLSFIQELSKIAKQFWTMGRRVSPPVELRCICGVASLLGLRHILPYGETSYTPGTLNLGRQSFWVKENVLHKIKPPCPLRKPGVRAPHVFYSVTTGKTRHF